LNVKITSIQKIRLEFIASEFFCDDARRTIKRFTQSWIMAFRQDTGQRVDMDVVRRFPNITAVNVQDSISQAQDILKQLIFAIQVLFLFTLLAGAIVL
jgi:putative ABC transport system permease protein